MTTHLPDRATLPLEAALMLDTLPETVRAARIHRGLSIRKAAAQIGVNFSTLDRLERRATDTRISVAKACLLWVAAGDAPEDSR